MSMEYKISKLGLRKFAIRTWAEKAVGILVQRVFTAHENWITLQEQISRFEEAKATGVPYITSYVDQTYHTKVWHQYYRESRSPLPSRTKEASSTGIRMFETILSRDPTIRRVLNLGVMCAYMDFQLATAHPDIEFTGVDFPEAIKTLNEKTFSAKNLHFYAGDIFEVLDHQGRFDAVMHIRTCCYLGPAEVERLYGRLALKGVRYILLQEPTGYSRVLRRLYDFERDDESVLYDSSMVIHNYPKMLARNGFHVLTQDLVKTYNPGRPDIHAIVITAAHAGKPHGGTSLGNTPA